MINANAGEVVDKEAIAHHIILHTAYLTWTSQFSLLQYKKVYLLKNYIVNFVHFVPFCTQVDT